MSIERYKEETIIATPRLYQKYKKDFKYMYNSQDSVFCRVQFVLFTDDPKVLDMCPDDAVLEVVVFTGDEFVSKKLNERWFPVERTDGHVWSRGLQKPKTIGYSLLNIMFSSCKVVHLGQLKLFWTELAFLRMCVDKFKREDFSILYLGASPGFHIPYLLKFFPNLTFTCYDPCKLKVKDNRITEVRECVTETTVVDFTPDLVFSDIRRKVEETRIVEDMRLQETIVKAVEPLGCLLKFRIPWSLKTKTFKYLDGTIMYQPFSKEFSTETRLACFDLTKNKEYNVSNYNKECWVWNSNRRSEDRLIPADMKPMITGLFTQSDFSKKYTRVVNEVKVRNASIHKTSVCKNYECTLCSPLTKNIGNVKQCHTFISRPSFGKSN